MNANVLMPSLPELAASLGSEVAIAVIYCGLKLWKMLFSLDAQSLARWYAALIGTKADSATLSGTDWESAEELILCHLEDFLEATNEWESEEWALAHLIWLHAPFLWSPERLSLLADVNAPAADREYERVLATEAAAVLNSAAADRDERRPLGEEIIKRQPLDPSIPISGPHSTPNLGSNLTKIEPALFAKLHDGEEWTSSLREARIIDAPVSEEQQKVVISFESSDFGSFFEALMELICRPFVIDLPADRDEGAGAGAPSDGAGPPLPDEGSLGARLHGETQRLPTIMGDPGFRVPKRLLTKQKHGYPVAPHPGLREGDGVFTLQKLMKLSSAESGQGRV